MSKGRSENTLSIQWRSPEELKELVKQDRPMKVLIMGMPRSGTMCTSILVIVLHS